MDRSRWLVTIVWFSLLAAGGTVGALVISDGKGVGWVLVGVLLVLTGAAFLWRRTYRWAQQDQERWRARYGKKSR